MDNLAEKESIMIGPPAGGGGARHDIMLPGHQRINIITLGKLSQPSYLTEIQIRLVLGYLRLRMSEKKGTTQIVEMALQASREMNYGSGFLKQ